MILDTRYLILTRVEPFPATRRRIYLVLFVLIFLAGLPAVILYADGWRFKSGLGFVRTGGIYIDVPYADATLSLNEEVIGESGFLQRDFYIGDLAPAAYEVHVERPGFRSWNRILVVEPQLVTDTHAIMLPEEIALLRLILSGTASSSKLVSRETYDTYLTAFATSTPMASSSIPVDEQDGVGLFIEDGDVLARWIRTDPIPSPFCISPSLCESEFSIKRIGGDATHAHFWSGGVVYRTEEGGIYFAEIDARPTPVSAQLYAAPGADMRLLDGSLIVQSDDVLYEIEAF